MHSFYINLLLYFTNHNRKKFTNNNPKKSKRKELPRNRPQLANLTHRTTTQSRLVHQRILHHLLNRTIITHINTRKRTEIKRVNCLQQRTIRRPTPIRQLRRRRKVLDIKTTKITRINHRNNLTSTCLHSTYTWHTTKTARTILTRNNRLIQLAILKNSSITMRTRLMNMTTKKHTLTLTRNQRRTQQLLQ